MHASGLTRMTIILIAIFLGFAAVAAGFAAWPFLREPARRGRLLLAGVLAAAVLGIGLGSYLMLGSPALALRTLAGPPSDDVRALVAVLAQRMRHAPTDPRGWALLGRGYLTLGDASDAAGAFKRGFAVAPPMERPDFLSAYAEALTLGGQGHVTPEAEAVFEQVLRMNPHDRAARYYLGQVAAQRGERALALALWQSLLADTPADTSLHNLLAGRIAMLSGNAGAAPDIHAMVEGLAARLKVHPNDAEGWRRLVRAYSVLGEKDKASAALKDGRAALKSDTVGLATLDAEAKSDGLK